MNKLICEVCGTAYPETATQCPICGCAKPETSGMPPLEGVDGAAPDRSYTYVKGGRFSKANVRKRNKANGTYRNYSPDEEDDLIEEELPPSNKGLILAIVLLILAIVAVVVYIIANFMGDQTEPMPQVSVPSTSEQTQPPEQTTAPTTETTLPEDLSCTELTLNNTLVTLTEKDQVFLINLTVTPANTTDEITYTSAAPEIATVSSDGRITAVATGTTEITVTCGEISATMTVECQLPEEGLDPNGNYAVYIDNKKASERKYKNDVTLNRNESFQLTLRDLDTDEVLEIEWVSGDESVCVVEGNTVKHVGRGNTKVTFTIGDTTYECKVTCT